MMWTHNGYTNFINVAIDTEHNEGTAINNTEIRLVSPMFDLLFDASFKILTTI